VPDLDCALFRDLRQGIDQSRAAADRFEREAAPELEPAFDLERLPPPGRGETHAFFLHPQRRGKALLDQDLGEVGIAAVLGDARHVVEELVRGVGPEIRPLDFLARQLDQPTEIVGAVVDDAQDLGGEGARDDRGAAARRERYDQADGLGRVGLRERRRRAKRGGGERRKSRRHENSSSYAAARTEGSAFPRSWRSTNGRMPPWT